jgi:alpha-glucosidase
MWPEAPPSTDGYHPTEIELHVFPGEGTCTLHEDDGLTLAGGHLRTTFTLSGDELRAEVEGGGYPEFARERFVVVVHGERPARHVLENRGEPFSLSLGCGRPSA